MSVCQSALAAAAASVEEFSATLDCSMLGFSVLSLVKSLRMTLHDLAMAAAVLVERDPRLFVFPVATSRVPSTPPHEAVDRPNCAYRLFMAHPDATAIGVVTGVTGMIVAIVVDPSARSWFGRNFARFAATRAHATPDGCQLIYKMPLPPYPIIGCPREPHNCLSPGVAVTAQGGFIIWPAPRGYEDCCPGYRVTADLPIAPLPLWAVQKVTAAAARPAVPVAFRPPRRGLDVQLDRLGSFIRYSRQRTLGERTVGAGRAAGQLVAQGLVAECQAVDLVAAAAEEAGLARCDPLTAARRGLRGRQRSGSAD